MLHATSNNKQSKVSGLMQVKFQNFFPSQWNSIIQYEIKSSVVFFIRGRTKASFLFLDFISENYHTTTALSLSLDI
jgi:hypothetical protein